MRTIYERLSEYSQSDYYGFHMPGHKRQFNMLGPEAPYAIDITEIDGFDDLHHAGGMIRDAQERAAGVYRADETHFLINGSSVGILSAVAGVTRRGDTVLVARNCHKSVYHAIYMNGLRPVYLMPGFDPSVQLNTEISAGDVRAALLREPKIRAVIIVSPTYDGVVSDIEAIAREVHARGIPLIVDEAHGAHFGFHPYFPTNANVKGADIVIHSLHKTLPSLTQTALLHMNGGIVRRERVREYLHMLQSSSPSYVLMASIDACVDLLENQREKLFGPYVRRLAGMQKKLSQLQSLRVVDMEGNDPSKIIISTRNTDLTGRQLYRWLLEKYHLQMEMAAGLYVLAMTSVGDTKEGMERLTEALTDIDRALPETVNTCLERNTKDKTSDIPCLPGPDVVYISSDMENILAGVDGKDGAGRAVSLPWGDGIGRVSAEYAYLYPPGCPLIVPGERVSQETADVLQWYYERGYSIEGLRREQYIEVL